MWPKPEAYAQMTDVRNHCLHTELIYDVAVIDPSNSSNEQSNLIALCPECAAKYAALKTPDDIARMTKIKEALVNAHDDQEIRADQHVQEGVRRVIEKIPFIKPPTDIDLNYDPVPVRQKISDFALYLRIKTDVNVYFKTRGSDACIEEISG